MTNLLRENMFLLRAGQKELRMLLVELCINTAVSAETGRWSRMDSIPFTRSMLSPARFSFTTRGILSEAINVA